MQCPACGKIQSDTASFCTGCGTRLPHAAPAPTSQPRTPQATRREGVELHAEHLTRWRGIGPKPRVTNDDISLHIGKGEFVAIIGVSGSGKSTLLNELSGREFATKGSVYVDGIDLYANYDALRSTIGVVPQQDIVYDGLTVWDTLEYAARLRMPEGTPKEERDRRIRKVIEDVQLESEIGSLVGNLSGGQKKRVSIAVERISEPQLLFLDEPASSLDPSLEAGLMSTLAQIAHSGSTVVLVTHSIANIDLCDRIVVLGYGGRLCFFGRPGEALAFFKVQTLSEVYAAIATDDQAKQLQGDFAKVRARYDPQPALTPAAAPRPERAAQATVGYQVRTLISRYRKLLRSDPGRLMLLILQGPFLAALIAAAAGENCFSVYEQTKSCLFGLACAAYWVGIFDSIQEVCKERAVYERERDSGLRVESYVLSKLAVLGSLCLVQALLFTAAFVATLMGVHGLSWTDGLLVTVVELLLTSTLGMLSAMCLGLSVSALVPNPDVALNLAPILVMPQILFSGVVAELTGWVNVLSYFFTARWAMSGFGTAAGIVGLPHSLVGKIIEGQEVRASWDLSALSPASDAAMYGQQIFGLVGSWSVMLVSSAVKIGLCLLFLRLASRKHR